jgi:hypothetical protein
MAVEPSPGAVDAALADALRPIVLLAVQALPACVAAAFDVFLPGVGAAGPARLTVASDDLLVPLHETAFALGEGPAPRAWRTGEVVVDELPSALGGRWDLLAADAGLASALSEPLVDEGKHALGTVGVFTVYGAARPGVRTADRRAVDLLATVGRSAIVGHLDADREREIDLPWIEQLVLDIGVPTIDLRSVQQHASQR